MTSVAPHLSPAEAAERLAEAGVHVSEDTVRRWARTGQITCLRLPFGRFLIPVEVVDAIATPVARQEAS